jgi:bacteriocin-like protein
MEEHTKTEQFLELDEEQLQTITGGTPTIRNFDQLTNNHLKKASDDVRMADLAKAHGLHNIGEGFAQLAADHMNEINKHLESSLNSRMNPARR